MKTIRTMTLTELANLLRIYGIKIGEETLSQIIEKGFFPFAVSANGKKKKCYLILEQEAIKWAEDHSN